MYSTSERGEGYIIVTYKGNDITLKSRIKLIRTMIKNLGMLVILKKYQGQGYMRQLMEMLYKIADEQNLAISFDTDAENKLEKYEHLGMSLAKTRDLGNGVFMYDLYRPAQGN